MKLFGTGDTPFQPANPALDIQDGDPRETTTVTNQSLNNLYGEVKLAIEGSGQTLTDVNGTSPNLGQLSIAIGTQAIGGEYYKDIGGSTANVKNIQNENGYSQTIKIGSIISFHNTISTNGGGGVITINVYNKPGELQMSAPLIFQGANLSSALTSQLFGGSTLSSKTIVTVMRTSAGFELLKMATVNSSQNVVTFFTGSKPFAIVTAKYSSQSHSTTGYNNLALPVNFASIMSITAQATQGTWSNNFYAVNVKGITSGNTVQYITFSNGQASPIGEGYITVMGYID
jgi:hypothetical protein